jgi:hypothetical protein
LPVPSSETAPPIRELLYPKQRPGRILSNFGHKGRTTQLAGSALLVLDQQGKCSQPPFWLRILKPPLSTQFNLLILSQNPPPVNSLDD